VVQKRLTKRQIKEDPLLTWTVRIETYLEQNLKRIAIIAGAIAVAIALIFVWRGVRRGAELAASEQLAQAQFQLWSGNPAPAAEIAKQVIDRHAGTHSGRMAHLVRGDALLGTGDPTGAMAEYKSFLEHAGGDAALRLVARRGLAVASENAMQYAEAAAAYEELAREGEGALDERRKAPQSLAMLKPEAAIIQDWTAAARCHERAGDPAKAKALYEEITAKYAAEPQIVEAKIHLAELAARAAEPTP
jgi:predicted negative regulator of RcsB-dependent stress response